MVFLARQTELEYNLVKIVKLSILKIFNEFVFKKQHSKIIR